MDGESARALQAAVGVGLVPEHERPKWRWRGTFCMPWPQCAAKWSPYGVAGDRLWIRENLALDNGVWHYAADKAPIQMLRSDDRYPSMLSWAHHKTADYCPSIHMPHWASRLTLEITEVRVERLQDISEADAESEGVQIKVSTTDCPPDKCKPLFNIMSPYGLTGPMDPDHVHRWEFAALWESLNKKRCPWSSNPWVWCLSFARVESAEDQKEAAHG